MLWKARMQPCQKLLKGKYMQPVCILFPRDCRKVCSSHAHSPFLQAVLISQSADVSKMTISFANIAIQSRKKMFQGWRTELVSLRDLQAHGGGVQRDSYGAQRKGDGA